MLSTGILLFLCIFSPILGSICRNQNDGKPCKRNSDCFHSRCFFGEKSQVGEGKCCVFNDERSQYFNSMFSNLINDENAIIPVEIFEPQREETCNCSKDCKHSEVCMVSSGKSGRQLNINEIKKHCYKKSPHWTQNPNSFSLQFCNSDTECSNNHCFELGNLTRTNIKRIWKTDKVIIYSPLIQKDRNKTVESAEMIMEEDDEIDERTIVWRMKTDVKMYFWKDEMTGCFFTFKGSRFETVPETPFRVRGANLNCDNQIEDVKEDLEIFGGTLNIETETMHYKGLCGNPGLKCTDCFINDKLFTCTDDKDCYNVGDKEWINRNEKSFCSDEVYIGKKLCKREQYTCPPDSLNENGTYPQAGLPCKVDTDCKNMKKFTKLPALNVTYYPHCFNGVCCARQFICESSEFPYGLPVEFNALGHLKSCDKHEDCTMFPDLVGTCIFDENARHTLKIRELTYLKTKKFMKKDYGMCCYKRNSECSTGGRPFQVELADDQCSTHSDCNPDIPPFKWNAYCSENSKNNTCCRDQTSNSMCPDTFTPYRTEPKCEDVNSIVEKSGSCPKKNGMCYKGHCCPRLTINSQKRATPYHSNYVTDTPCDPTVPLDMTYQWAFCDEKEQKIVVMGTRKWNGQELEWQKKRCNVNRDCGHIKFVCVHKLYDLRYCVVSPNYRLENNQLDLSYLTITIIAIFFGIIVIIVWTPTAVFQ